jgi:hypothetical protein
MKKAHIGLIFSTLMLTSCFSKEKENAVTDAYISRTVYEQTVVATAVQPTELKWNTPINPNIEADKNQFYYLPENTSCAGLYSITTSTTVSGQIVYVVIYSDARFSQQVCSMAGQSSPPGNCPVNKGPYYIKVYGNTTAKYTLGGNCT